MSTEQPGISVNRAVSQIPAGSVVRFHLFALMPCRNVTMHRRKRIICLIGAVKCRSLPNSLTGPHIPQLMFCHQGAASLCSFSPIGLPRSSRNFRLFGNWPFSTFHRVLCAANLTVAHNLNPKSSVHEMSASICCWNTTTHSGRFIVLKLTTNL